MSKCEHHEDYIRLHDGLKETVDRLERNTNEKLETFDHKLNTAFERIDSIKDIQHNRYVEQKETESYVKQLYGKVDELMGEMKNVVVKMDQHIQAFTIQQTKVEAETEKNTEFSQQGKKLVFEVIKYLVLLFLGYSFAK